MVYVHHRTTICQPLHCHSNSGLTLDMIGPFIIQMITNKFHRSQLSALQRNVEICMPLYIGHIYYTKGAHYILVVTEK